MKKTKIIFFGTPDFAVKSLKVINENFHVLCVVTSPDKKSGRGLRIHQSEVKKFSIINNLLIKQPEDLKNIDFINLHGTNFDLNDKEFKKIQSLSKLIIKKDLLLLWQFTLNNLEKKGLNLTLIDARFCKPLDENLMWNTAKNHEVVISIEEGSIGGFGSHLSKFLSEKGLLEKIKFRSMTFPDNFIDQDKPDLMYQIAGLNSKAIEEKVYEVLDSKVVVQKKN